jgi:hypothetical protein
MTDPATAVGIKAFDTAAGASFCEAHRCLSCLPVWAIDLALIGIDVSHLPARSESRIPRRLEPSLHMSLLGRYCLTYLRVALMRWPSIRIRTTGKRITEKHHYR